MHSDLANSIWSSILRSLGRVLLQDSHPTWQVEEESLSTSVNCKGEIKQLDTDVLSRTMHSTSYQGTWVHWDIASSKVGQPSSEVTGCLLRKFPLTRAAAHCSIGQAHVLQQPRLNTGCGSRPGGTHRWFPLKVPRPGPELDLHATLHIKLPAPSALLAVCNTFSKIQLYI